MFVCVCVCRESSCEAGESELNESQEEQSIRSVSSSLVPGHAPIKRKRLRKRIVVGMRKKLRTHMESVEEFNPEARDAQSAELERIRRLKLQRQMMNDVEVGKGGVVVYPSHSATGDLYEKTVVERGKMEGEECAVQGLKSSSSPEVLQVEAPGAVATTKRPQCPPLGVVIPPEAIVIDSGSSDSDASGCGVVKYPQGQVYPRIPSSLPRMPQNVKKVPMRVEGQQLHTKYDVMGSQQVDGRVLVNQGHTHNEPDVFLASQIGRVAKAHQVSSQCRS